MIGKKKLGERMPYCDIESVLEGSMYEKNWCVDHQKSPTHVAPNGDDVVCDTYAEEEGCNCCPKNYGKAEMNERLHRFMWEHLEPEVQTMVKREFERRIAEGE